MEEFDLAILTGGGESGAIGGKSRGRDRRRVRVDLKRENDSTLSPKLVIFGSTAIISPYLQATLVDVRRSEWFIPVFLAHVVDVPHFRFLVVRHHEQLSGVI